jgi:hypothetical protein
MNIKMGKTTKISTQNILKKTKTKMKTNPIKI